MSMPLSLEERFGIPRTWNPIIKFAIKPALRLANASEHPIRGGICAALATGLAHYLVFELARYVIDFVTSPGAFPRDAHRFLAGFPLPVHVFVAINMASNLALGVVRAVIGKEAWEAEMKKYSRKSGIVH